MDEGGGGRRGSQFPMDLTGFAFLSQVDQSCSLALISTCICMCQPKQRGRLFLPPPNLIRAVFHSSLHVPTSWLWRLAVQSSSVTVEQPWSCRALVPDWIRGRNDWLSKAGKQSGSLKGDFHYRQHNSREEWMEEVHAQPPPDCSFQTPTRLKVLNLSLCGKPHSIWCTFWCWFNI